jgi:CYTH domain-containing protein/predicted ATPase
MENLLGRYCVKAPVMTTIAIAGGPMGGKSTLFRALEQRYGKKIVHLSETATVLFQSGLAQPPYSAETRHEWLRGFQEMIMHTQIMRELETEQRMVGSKDLLLVDRGTLDAAAYLPGGIDEMCELFGGLSIEELYHRYHAVIYLPSVVVIEPERFGPEGNAQRYETAEEARALEEATWRAWSGHPNVIRIDPAGGIEAVIDRAIEALQPWLLPEVERRWILPALPDCYQGIIPSQIQQKHRLMPDGTELRLRKDDNTYWQTIKFAGGLTRRQEEYQLSRGAFTALWDGTEGPVITKSRYIVRVVDGGPYHIDLHHGALEGLVKLEREFSFEHQAHAFVLPDDFIGAEEVTADARFTSLSLAYDGLVSL